MVSRSQATLLLQSWHAASTSWSRLAAPSRIITAHIPASRSGALPLLLRDITSCPHPFCSNPLTRTWSHGYIKLQGVKTGQLCREAQCATYSVRILSLKCLLSACLVLLGLLGGILTTKADTLLVSVLQVRKLRHRKPTHSQSRPYFVKELPVGGW